MDMNSEPGGMGEKIVAVCGNYTRREALQSLNFQLIGLILKVAQIGHKELLEKIMLMAYEPRNVREAQERSSNIYAAIRAYKRMGTDNQRIRKEIAEEYEITPAYAQNYIDTVDKEAKEKASIIG